MPSPIMRGAAHRLRQFLVLQVLFREGRLTLNLWATNGDVALQARLGNKAG